MKKQILSEEFKRLQKLAGIITEGQAKKMLTALNENIKDYYGEIQAAEDEFDGAMQTGDYTEEEYLETLLDASSEELEDSEGGYYEIANVLSDLSDKEKQKAIKNIKKWAQSKYDDLGEEDEYDEDEY